MKGRKSWGWERGVVLFQKTKKLSNRKRELGNDSLRCPRGEVAHTHKKGTWSTSTILNYGHSEDEEQVISQKSTSISTDFSTVWRLSSSHAPHPTPCCIKPSPRLDSAWRGTTKCWSHYELDAEYVYFQGGIQPQDHKNDMSCKICHWRNKNVFSNIRSSL